MTPTLSVPTAVLFLPCNKLTPPVLSFFSFLAGIIHFPEHLRQSLFTCLVVILRRFCSVLLFPRSVPTALPNQTIASKFLFCFCLLSPPHRSSHFAISFSRSWLVASIFTIRPRRMFFPRLSSSLVLHLRMKPSHRYIWPARSPMFSRCLDKTSPDSLPFGLASWSKLRLAGCVSSHHEHPSLPGGRGSLGSGMGTVGGHGLARCTSSSSSHSSNG